MAMSTLRQWHWISSAICLISMLLFAVTGITLNHASQISAQPRTLQHRTALPSDLLLQLRELAHEDMAPLPPAARAWLNQQLPQRIGAQPAEWSEQDVYLSLPRPGGDAWLAIDLASGQLEYEHIDRGWVAYFNDLHKGRHAGAAWSWFIDLFALACVVFCVSGLLLLQRYSAQRSGTWPMVALGLLIPFLIAFLFVH